MRKHSSFFFLDRFASRAETASLREARLEKEYGVNSVEVTAEKLPQAPKVQQMGRIKQKIKLLSPEEVALPLCRPFRAFSVPSRIKKI